MSLNLYMDVHVDRAVTNGLRRRGIDILTAQEDGAGRYSDPELLTRASELGRVLFTHDYDFLVEAHARQASNLNFEGLIFAQQTQVSIGEIIRDLELIAVACELGELRNRVQFLPIR